VDLTKTESPLFSTAVTVRATPLSREWLLKAVAICVVFPIPILGSFGGVEPWTVGAYVAWLALVAATVKTRENTRFVLDRGVLTFFQGGSTGHGKVISAVGRPGRVVRYRPESSTRENPWVLMWLDADGRYVIGTPEALWDADALADLRDRAGIELESVAEPLGLDELAERFPGIASRATIALNKQLRLR
jgi:hypothetical protein